MPDEIATIFARLAETLCLFVCRSRGQQQDPLLLRLALELAECRPGLQGHMVFKDRHTTNELGLWCISALPSSPRSTALSDVEQYVDVTALQTSDRILRGIGSQLGKHSRGLHAGVRIQQQSCSTGDVGASHGGAAESSPAPVGRVRS